MGGEYSTNGEIKNIYIIYNRKLEGGKYVGDVSVDARIILKWSLQKECVRL
jgi:hypothetical protein